MPVVTGVPTNIRRPGILFTFSVSQAQRGLVPVNQRVALVGARMSSGSIAAATPVQIFSVSDGDTYFGVGSELALMCRAALAAAAAYGASPEIWACACEDPSGTAQTNTLTTTASGAVAGNLVISIAGRLITVGVNAGDAQNTIAAAINAAVQAQKNTLPVSSGVATNVVTLTANNVGVNGKDCAVSVVSAPAGVTCVAAAGATGAGAAVITSAIDALVDKQYHALAVANHTGTDLTALGTYLDMEGAYNVKQFSNAFVAETGTLSTGTTESTGSNRRDCVVITAEAWPNMTGEIAAMVATVRAAEERPNISFDGVVLPLFPPAASVVYTGAEIETALAAGATPLSVNKQGQPVIVKLVSCQTTLNGVSFFGADDLSVNWSLDYMAVQLDDKLAIAFSRDNADVPTEERVWTVVYEGLKEFEAAGIIQNVDAHRGEIVVEQDSVSLGRFNIAAPVSVTPNLHQLAAVENLLRE